MDWNNLFDAGALLCKHRSMLSGNVSPRSSRGAGYAGQVAGGVAAPSAVPSGALTAFADAVLRLLSGVWCQRAVRGALALVFMAAGGAKLADVRGFAEIIHHYGILPVWAVGPVALLLPLAEVIAGVGLLFAVRGSLAAIAAMCLLFLGVLGYALATGLSIGDCGCFAPGELPEGVQDGSALRGAFVRDLALLAGVAYLCAWRRLRRRMA
ncbi:Methylamine utilization protein MauE [anaerobic digester metagenome]